MRVRARAAARGDHSVERILVATDGSETADWAVRWAAGMASAYGAELVVLRVVGSLGGEVEAELGRYAAQVGGTTARARVTAGDDPAAAIVRVAKEEAADVVVVGSVGMQGRKEFLLGNVPNRVSHNAPCTVVIVDTTPVASAKRRRRG
jgi:ubiquinone biosynthesis protein